VRRDSPRSGFFFFFALCVPATAPAAAGFSEAFTRYDQDRVLLRAGLVDYPPWLERLNRIIAAYRSSPDRNWTQARWLARRQAHNAR
jgi:hypothetical protein